jgi:lysophospholipase L1-like esterase
MNWSIHLKRLVLFLVDLALAATLLLVPVLWVCGTMSMTLGPAHFSVRWSMRVFVFVLAFVLARAGLYAWLGQSAGYRGLWHYPLAKKLTLALSSIFLAVYGAERILVLVHFEAQLPPIIIKGSQKEVIGRDGIIGDPELGWKFSPGGMFKGWKINSMGFREREVDPVKKPGAMRVICLGDSCTADGGPPYSGCLNQLLTNAPPTAQPWEAFNMAMYGFSSVHGLRMFRKKGKNLQPDYVTIYFGWNDHWLCGYRPDSANLSIELSPRAAAAYELMRRKLVGQLLFRLLTRGQNMAIPKVKGQLPSDIEDYLRVPKEEYRQVLGMLAAEIKSVGAIPVFITAPRNATLTHLVVYNGQAKSLHAAVTLHDEYCEITRGVAKKTGSVLLDLRAILANDEENNRLFGKDGIHFTQQGLWRVAEEIYKAIYRDAAPAAYDAWAKNFPAIDASLAALATTWSGTVENDTNRFDTTLQVKSPAARNGVCATFSGDGSLRFVRVEGNTVICTGTTARSDYPLGADDQLRLLPDGTLLYDSRSEYGETVGPIRKR